MTGMCYSILHIPYFQKHFVQHSLFIFCLKLNTFENLEAAKSDAAELSDGVAMCQCLAAM